MKNSRLNKKTEEPHGDDLAFLPPYSEQAKYLHLADKALSTNGRHNVVSIDSSKHFRRRKKTRKAA